jgi:peptide/nickel transport system permease protein
MKFVSYRLMLAVPTLCLIAIIAFSLPYMVPGDPARELAGQDQSAENIRRIRDGLGLNQPYFQRLWEWVSGIFKGNFGTSIFTQIPVRTGLAESLPVTSSLTALAIFITVAIAFPMGIVAGLRPHSWADRIVTMTASIGIAIPNFWLGLMLVLVFAIHLRWLPALGYVSPDDPGQWLLHLILPAVTLALPAIAEVNRQLRASILDVAPLDYVRTARAKGLPERKVVLKHLLKNTAGPAVTALGIQVAYMLGGTVIVEQVFGLPGLGSYAINAIDNRDFPVIQAIVLFAGLVVVIINISVDLLHGLLSPVIRA